MLKTFHMDRQELHQFISDIYDYRKPIALNQKKKKKNVFSIA